jgi:hypothetical protein
MRPYEYIAPRVADSARKSNSEICSPLSSGTISILDEDTHDLVAAIKITDFKDLQASSASHAKFQHIFSYFTTTMLWPKAI